ncbi:MAG: hypothetical protein B9S32_09690 [Verrucomicrobia bacterium Tous-C9LFEB]|nr:MAG: hypothetical protein B9S32_09690 [Verrucomicrobia bacterium Tous-C9LFEB]
MAIAPLKPDLPNPWPFDQPPNCAVFTTVHVMRQGKAITHIFHDEDDHGWQFHYPGAKTTSDLMIVALKEIYFHDPTVIEVADLLPGWKAVRSNVGAPWKREKNEPDSPQSTLSQS